MKILFTTNKQCGSRFIRWGTDGSCSHIALCFDEEDGEGVVFHSTGTKGTHPVWLSTFLQKNKVVYALGFSPEIDTSVEDSIFKAVVTDHSGEGYDFKALLFWFFMGLRRKLFGTELPEKNEWAKAGYNLCTALLEPVQQHLPQYFWGPSVDWEMLSPQAIYDLLSKRDGFYAARAWTEERG
jgi:hypothetical protein